jgi:hypothetical protein
MSANNIFLAPRSNETSYKNFTSTILEGRSYEYLSPYLTGDERKVLSKYQGINISIWGNKESLRGRWEKMEPGDLVLFYKDGAFYYSARVVLTKYDEKLGKALWPVDKNGKPWPCLFFVDKLTEINIPVELIQELAEYAPTWDRVQGFMRLNDHGVEAIKNKFGTLERFVRQDVEALKVIENIVEDAKSETIETEPLKAPDINKLMREASTYVDSGPGFVIDNSARKRRIENREQKRRVAEIEGRACQICNWSLEWQNKKGEARYRIDVDHIIDKAKGGGEELKNLWALCPNCHAEKTMGVIHVDLEKKKILRDGIKISLHHDRHLFV